MNNQDKLVQAKKLLRKIPFLSPETIEEITESKTYLWIKLCKLTRNSINYHFDEDIQYITNKVFDELNNLLGTKKGSEVKQKGRKKLEEFPQIILKIQNGLDDEIVKIQKEQANQQFIQEKAMANVMEQTIPRWTFSELVDLVKLKLKRYEHVDKKTVQQKRLIDLLNKFQQFISDLEVDSQFVDMIIRNRISTNPNDTLNSSVLSSVSQISVASSDSSFLKQIDEIDQAKREITQNGFEQSSEIKENSNANREQNLFIKKNQSNFLDSLEVHQENQSFKEEIVPQVPPRVEKKEEEPKPVQQSVQNQNRMKHNELPVFETSRPQPEQQQITQPQQQTDNNLQQNHHVIDSDFTVIDQSILKSEDKKQYLGYSEQLIERCANQSRFTIGTFENRRQLEVQQIIQNQLQPLLQQLKGITTRHLDRFSQSFAQVTYQVYGSFQNKAGFRKTSDININLTIPGIQQRNMHSTLFGLRNYLDNLRKRGMLNSMNLRSVIYSQQHQEVILSHQNNRNKLRVPHEVNFIYLTINRNDYVLSSRFIGEVIYSKKDKTTDIAHLTNLLHLLFKGNCILDHKDIYHIWWIQTPSDRVRRDESQSRYVSISIYAMHMMVLYYLISEGIISKIRYEKQSQSYDFELLNHKITLFEMFGGFLRFYSSQGDYVKNHAETEYIDVISNRPLQLQNKIVSQAAKSISSIQKEYLFNFLHPRSDILIDQKPEKCISFEIAKKSHQQQLFFKKIDEMLRVVQNLRNGQRFEPNELFGWNQLQFER